MLDNEDGKSKDEYSLHLALPLGLVAIPSALVVDQGP